MPQGACPAILSFLPQTAAAGRPTICCAHNSAFDLKMLRSELDRCGEQMPSNVWFACTLKMFREARNTGQLDVPDCRLGTIYEQLLGTQLSGAHGASLKLHTMCFYFLDIL